MRAALNRLELPPLVAADFVISNMQLTTEGDDQRGYRIRVAGMGSQPTNAFVARIGGQYRIIGFDANLAGLGAEALRQIQAGNLLLAKQWLDWAREEISRPGGDDPFQWPAFPDLWTRGDSADGAKMRSAALSLLAGTDFIKPYLPELKTARANATSRRDATAAIVLLAAYRGLEQWAELKDLGWQMLQLQPTSTLAFTAVLASSAKLHDWTTWDKAIALRLEKLPDDHDALTSRAHWFEGQGKIAEGRAVLKQLIDTGRASDGDLNQYGWDALFTGKVEPADIELVQRASANRQNSDSNTVHTLACLYAEVGKTKEAYELLLHTIAVSGLDEPDSAVWYGLGRLAEQYGERGAALATYKRMEDREDEATLPTSTWNLGQKRLRALRVSGD
jgi:tetratricopeptide (TPR) repeat protein